MRFRGGRRRSSMARPVIQSYKKIIKIAPASYTAGFQNQIFLTGVDSIAAGQTGPTDGNVPTGSIIKYVEIQMLVANLAAAAGFINASIQYTLSGQSFINPELMGGHNQRNQCLHMDLFAVGEGQNSTHKFRFKVPKKFQRVREGTKWSMTWANNTTVTNASQMIYKFYR